MWVRAALGVALGLGIQSNLPAEDVVTLRSEVLVHLNSEDAQARVLATFLLDKLPREPGDLERVRAELAATSRRRPPVKRRVLGSAAAVRQLGA